MQNGLVDNDVTAVGKGCNDLDRLDRATAAQFGERRAGTAASTDRSSSFATASPGTTFGVSAGRQYTAHMGPSLEQTPPAEQGPSDPRPPLPDPRRQQIRLRRKEPTSLFKNWQTGRASVGACSPDRAPDRPNPSLITVDSVAHALNTDFVLARDDSPDRPLGQRPDDAVVVWSSALGSRAVRTWPPPASLRRNCGTWTLEPNDVYQAEADPAGSQELYVVLSGRLTVWCRGYGQRHAASGGIGSAVHGPALPLREPHVAARDLCAYKSPDRPRPVLRSPNQQGGDFERRDPTGAPAHPPDLPWQNSSGIQTDPETTNQLDTQAPTTATTYAGAMSYVVVNS